MAIRIPKAVKQISQFVDRRSGTQQKGNIIQLPDGRYKKLVSVGAKIQKRRRYRSGGGNARMMREMMQQQQQNMMLMMVMLSRH